MPKEVDMTNDLNYFPHNCMLGHNINDCINFKNLLEHCNSLGGIILPKDYLDKKGFGSITVVLRETSNPISDIKG